MLKQFPCSLVILKCMSVILCGVGLWSCTQRHEAFDPYAPAYEGYPQGIVQHIHIQDSRFKNLYPDDYTILCDTTSIDCASFSVIHVNGKLLSVSRGKKTMKSTDTNSGQLLNEFNLVGRGPGEYQEIFNVTSDGSSVILMDGPSFKVIRYDSEMTFIDERFISNLDVFGNMAYRHPHLVYGIRQDPEYLVRMINLDNPDEVSDFHRRIIALGMQPAGYNNALVSMSSEHEVAVLSGNLPLLFIYRNIINDETPEPDLILRLHHEELNLIGKPVSFNFGSSENTIENPPIEAFPLSNGKIVSLTPMFQNFVFDTEWIFIRQLPEKRLLVLRKKGSRYEHVGSYRLIDQHGQEIGLGNMSYLYPWLYVGSGEGIIRINVQNLK
jgi:hypothetical protein